MLQSARWMVVVLVASLAVPIAWAQQQWIEYRPPGAGYRIEYPGQPSPFVDDSPPGRGPRMYGVEFEAQGGTGYYASVYNDYGNAEANPEAWLDVRRDAAARGNPGASLRNEQRIMIGGVAARRIVIDVAPKKLVIVQLMAISGDRLYQASWVGPRGSENGADVARFLGSFAFVPR